MLDRIRKWICWKKVERFVLHTYDGQPDVTCPSVYECRIIAEARLGKVVTIQPHQIREDTGVWFGLVEDKVTRVCIITRIEVLERC